MKDMQSRIKTVAVAAVVSALTVAGLAVAQNDDDGGGSDKSGKAKAGQRPPGPPPGGGFLIGGGPGDRGGSLTYSETHLQKNGEDVTIRSDRGKVVSASDDEISIRRNDGETVELAVDGDTKVLAGPRRRGIHVADLATGKRVVVIRDDDDDAADAVLVEPKNRPKLIRHRFGGPPPGGGDAPAPPSFDDERG